MKCKKCKSENIMTNNIVFVSFGRQDKYRASSSKTEYICQDCGNKGDYCEVIDDEEFKKLLEEI